MIALPELERRLCAARPEIEGTPPPVSRVLATVAQAPAAAPRRRWRKGRRTPLALPALIGALLLAGGGATAALVLSSGEPVAPAYVLFAKPNAGLGEPLPASIEILPTQVPDPEGGPPWGMRVIRTTRGLLCLQAGRVVRGQLGGLGTGYAFNADQQFHPFLAEDAVATDACPAVGTSGTAFLPGPPVIVPANGVPLAGENVAHRDEVHCDLPGQEDWGVRCPQQELRQVAFGLLGPHATSIRVTPQDGSSFTMKPYGPLGAYLIVLPAQPDANAHMSSGSYVGPFGNASNAPGGAVLRITYDDGSECRIPFVSTGQHCRAHGTGAEAIPPPSVPGAPIEAAYLSVAKHPEAPLLMDDASGATFNGAARGAGPALEISFRAPLAVTDAASAYAAEVKPASQAGCKAPALIVSQPTQRTLAKGAEVQITVPLESTCATRYSGRVFFATSASIGGESGGEGPLYEAIAGHFGLGARRGSESALPTVGRFELAGPGH